MTDDEKRQQKAMLWLECQEAAEELAHLSEKARRFTEKLRVLIDFIERARPGEMKHAIYVDKDPTRRAELLSKIMGAPEYRSSVSFDAVLILVNELDEASRKLSELQKQKQSFVAASSGAI